MRFFIKQYSTLPQLRMEIVNDGRGDFRKYFDSIQNADIYFTMTNVDTSVIKISNAPCYIKEKEDGGCSEEYVICYDWQKRDTKEKGTYEGEFLIVFHKDLTSESETYPSGELLMPIREKLEIIIQ